MSYFFDALELALSSPSPLADYSLRSLSRTKDSLQSDVIAAINTSEASFIARCAREWAVRGDFKDSNADALVRRVLRGDLTEEMLKIMVHIIEKHFAVGVFVRTEHQTVVRPEGRHEVLVRLVQEPPTDNDPRSTFRVLAVDYAGHTCGTPFEVSR
tara:strand:+ start:2301 stop:2768 length:468 start_codon:yes stop_codon:yes gene_type:complete